MDSVGAFNVFVHVAEARSFVAAGKALGVSASAIGKSIARLEERVGARLFHRSTRSIALTAEGTRFLEHCRRILAEIEAAQDEILLMTKSPRGRLRISMPMLDEPFVAVLARFQKAYPEVELELDFTDRWVDLIDEGFDAVIRSGDLKDSRLSSKRLGDYKRAMVGSPEYFSRWGIPSLPQDLMSHKCIHFRYPQTGKLQPWSLSDEGHSLQLDLPKSTTCSTLHARLSFALNGVGIAYLPEFAVRDRITAGELVTILDEYTDYQGTFRLLWPSSKHTPPKLRALIDFVSTHVQLD